MSWCKKDDTKLGLLLYRLCVVKTERYICQLDRCVPWHFVRYFKLGCCFKFIDRKHEYIVLHISDNFPLIFFVNYQETIEKAIGMQTFSSSYRITFLPRILSSYKRIFVSAQKYLIASTQTIYHELHFWYSFKAWAKETKFFCRGLQKKSTRSDPCFLVYSFLSSVDQVSCFCCTS